jgi:hypothetical protein
MVLLLPCPDPRSLHQWIYKWIETCKMHGTMNIKRPQISTSDYLRLWGDGRVGRHLVGRSSMRGSGQARWMAPARPQPWPCTSTGEPISWQNSTMCISIPRPPPSPLRFHSGTSGALSGMTSLFQSYGEHFWAACSCARFTSISPGAFPTSMSFPLSLLSLPYPPIIR